MTNTYNTLNPLESMSAKDLLDNASNFDEGMNSLSPSFYDRFKRRRETWAGMEKMVQDFLEAMGFEATHLQYVDGTPLTVLRPTQLIDRAGSVYKVKQPASFPVNLTGTWATDQLLLVDVGDASLRQALADTSSASNGAGMIGWKRNSLGAVGRPLSEKLSGSIDVKDFGAKGDGITDDWAAIDAARAFAKSAASVSVGPSYLVPPLWFPHGTYLISKPIWFDEAHQIDGDNARIVAMPGFTGATIPLFGGGTEVNSNMFIFLKGEKGTVVSVPNPARWKAKVGTGITLDCQDIAAGGIYIERMPYSRINCEIQFSPGDGIQFGPSSWGMNLDDIVIENFTGYALHFLENSAFNGASINNPRIWGEFKTGAGGLLFDNNAECNGLIVSGGFIEKVDYGCLVSGGNGPITFQGVDFEQCTFNVCRAAIIPRVGQKIGPITFNACFAHSISSSKFYADYATINVEGCRMFTGSADFETEGLGFGIINAKDNRYMAGDTVGLGAAVTMAYEQNDGLTKQYRNYLNHKSNSFFPVYDIRNYQFRDAPTLQSSGFNFYMDYTGGGTGQYVGRSDWWVAEYQHVTAPGVLNKTIGVRLANDSGQNSFQPMFNNVTQCGAAGAAWAGGATQVAFTVTSDARSKMDIREISEAEKRVAVKCKGLSRSYLLTAEHEKLGDKARRHIGVIAQDILAAFASEGLDAMDYKLVEFDKWDAKPEVRDEEGILISESIAAGETYSVRYEQLAWFVMSTL